MWLTPELCRCHARASATAMKILEAKQSEHRFDVCVALPVDSQQRPVVWVNWNQTICCFDVDFRQEHPLAEGGDSGRYVVDSCVCEGEYRLSCMPLFTLYPGEGEVGDQPPFPCIVPFWDHPNSVWMSSLDVARREGV